MKKEDLFFRSTHSVKGYHVDPKQQATVPAILRIIHDTAMQHVQKVGISAKELKAYDLSWVLHREHIEFFRRPDLGEPISVLTYASGLEKLFTYRDFKWYDQQGHLLGQAASTWFLMNTAKRKIGIYPTFIRDFIELSNQHEHLPRPKSLSGWQGNVDWQQIQVVKHHDLDFNGHLSNYYFARWMLDNLPDDWYKHQEIAGFSLNFREECNLGDKIVVNARQEKDGFVYHQMLRGGKEVARGSSQWKKKTNH